MLPDGGHGGALRGAGRGVNDSDGDWARVRSNIDVSLIIKGAYRML